MEDIPPSLISSDPTPPIVPSGVTDHVRRTETKTAEDTSFVLPVLYDIEDSEGDDQELVRHGVGTMRKKDVNEGKEYENDGDEVVKTKNKRKY